MAALYNKQVNNHAGKMAGGGENDEVFSRV
jgi:hypothetical protein